MYAGFGQNLSVLMPLLIQTKKNLFQDLFQQVLSLVTLVLERSGSSYWPNSNPHTSNGFDISSLESNSYFLSREWHPFAASVWFVVYASVVQLQARGPRGPRAFSLLIVMWMLQ